VHAQPLTSENWGKCKIKYQNAVSQTGQI